MLAHKLTGHYAYYGVTGNSLGIQLFYQKVFRMTYKWWNRRSQQRSGSMEEFQRRVLRHPLPMPHITHVFHLTRAT